MKDYSFERSIVINDSMSIIDKYNSTNLILNTIIGVFIALICIFFQYQIYLLIKNENDTLKNLITIKCSSYLNKFVYYDQFLSLINKSSNDLKDCSLIYFMSKGVLFEEEELNQLLTKDEEVKENKDISTTILKNRKISRQLIPFQTFHHINDSNSKESFQELIKRNINLENLNFLDNNNTRTKEYLLNVLINKQAKFDIQINDDVAKIGKSVKSLDDIDSNKISFKNSTNFIVRIMIYSFILVILLILYIVFLLFDSTLISNYISSYYLNQKLVQSRSIINLNSGLLMPVLYLSKDDIIYDFVTEKVLLFSSNEAAYFDLLFKENSIYTNKLSALEYSPLCEYFITNFKNNTYFFDVEYNSNIYLNNNNTKPIYDICKNTKTYKGILNRPIYEVLEFSFNYYSQKKDKANYDIVNDLIKDNEYKAITIINQFAIRNMIDIQSQYICLDFDKSMEFNRNMMIMKRIILMIVVFIIFTIYYRYFLSNIEEQSIINEIFISIMPEEYLRSEIENKQKAFSLAEELIFKKTKKKKNKSEDSE